MTVEFVGDILAGVNLDFGERKVLVVCKWFHSGKVQTEHFLPELLKHADQADPATK